MKFYKKIDYFSNKSRIKSLVDFRDNIVWYFNSRRPSDYDMRLYDTDESKLFRTKINLSLDKVRNILYNANVSTTGHYKAPFGAYIVENMDFLANIFNTQGIQEQIVDMIEIWIGKYQDNEIPSLLRTINPFYWIQYVISFIIDYILKLFGVPSYLLAHWWLSKTVSFFANLLTIASILRPLYKNWHLNFIINWFK